MSSKIKLAIMASGGGSNADKICSYFSHHYNIEVALIISNRKNAGVLTIAEKYDIEDIYIDKATWDNVEAVKGILTDYQIDYIILAGFLKLIPYDIIQHWRDKIINIHPSLLPKFGGKDMYGLNVHNAVKAAKEKTSGMTIHLVNEEYDKGEILFQATCHIEPDMTPEDIAKNVLILEHLHYSPTIENFVLMRLNTIAKN